MEHITPLPTPWQLKEHLVLHLVNDTATMCPNCIDVQPACYECAEWFDPKRVKQAQVDDNMVVTGCNIL